MNNTIINQEYIKGQEAVILQALAKRLADMGAGRNDWEINFFNGVQAQISSKGWISFKQADTVRNHAVRMGVMEAARVAKAEPEAIRANELRQDLLKAGEQLGAGMYRKGFAVEQAKGLIIKRGHGQKGQAQCKFEANLFAKAGRYAAILAPCWMEGEDLVMMKVTDYQNSGYFAPCGNGYKHTKCGRMITAENYDLLLAFSQEVENINGEKFWDCAPNGRTQGGWIGDRFVITDYAL